MQEIAENLRRIAATLPPTATLVAVSKYHPESELEKAYAAGQRDFGESHVQELVRKAAALPADIRWHFIGHLQRNKVRQLLPHVSLIHSGDSPRLLREISKESLRLGRKTDCLLQVHVAAEETKFGFTPEELRLWMAGGEWRQLEGVRLCGLMCMATNTDDEARIRADFRQARQLFEELRTTYFPADEGFSVRSYGMSGDYAIALEEGSTMVRIGTAIFGERTY